MANFLDSLRQAFYPGYRIPRVDNWDGLKKLPMPRDCEGFFRDGDDSKPFVYYKCVDVNGVETCRRYRIDQLGAQLESCCCSIKTTMLQQQLDAARANEVRLQNQLDNRDQTQVLLGTLGRWVAWAGNGTQAAAAAG